MSTQATNWTPEEVEKLKNLVGSLSYTEIGKVVNRSKYAVKNKIALLGLKHTVQPLPKKLVKKESSPSVEDKKPPLIALYKNHTPYKSQEKEVVRKIEWCKECHSPVSNWVEHAERLGCKRA